MYRVAVWRSDILAAKWKARNQRCQKPIFAHADQSEDSLTEEIHHAAAGGPTEEAHPTR